MGKSLEQFETFLKEYYGEYYVDSLPALLAIGMSMRIAVLIRDKDYNYYLQDIYTNSYNGFPVFGSIDRITSSNKKELAQKYGLHNKGNIRESVITEALNRYKKMREEQDNILYEPDPAYQGKHIVPYKIICNYFRYFGKEQADKLIRELDEKYDFHSGIYDLFWEFRDYGYCETLDKKRLFYVMYVLSEEYLLFESPHFKDCSIE